MSIKPKKIISSAGDTIIEVLISISIAGLALGISYAIASKATTRAISARERDQAVGIMESQLARLKAIEQQVGFTSFNSSFSDTTAPHFCVNSSSITPVLNHGIITGTSNLTTQAPAPYYDPQCNQAGYYIDIESVIATGNKVPRDNYYIHVRWLPLHGGANNQVTIYYRF